MDEYKKVKPKQTEDVLLNPGMGYLYSFRGSVPVPFECVDRNAWYLKEKISDKIEVSVPWSVIEPKENTYDWENPLWEGFFNSWISAGFKVSIKVRGMSSRGTLYNDGTPQWVFDKGAKYIDEDFNNYVNLPGFKKIRVPVYWDDMYVKCASNFIEALGDRYNHNPAIEFVQMAHMGQWGEMHVSGHSDKQPWLDAGFSFKKYFDAHKKLINAYKKAFSNKRLSQAIGEPIFNHTNMHDVAGMVDFLVENNIMIKYGGLGCNFHEGTNPFLEKIVQEYYNENYHKVPMYMENATHFCPMAVAKTGLACHLSYYNRGGEATGFGMPWHDSQVADIIRYSARTVGYRFVLKSFECLRKIKKGENTTVLYEWVNKGSAPCYEDYDILFSLVDEKGRVVFEEHQGPKNKTSSLAWDKNKTVEEKLIYKIDSNIPTGYYQIYIGMCEKENKNNRIELGIVNKGDNKTYYIGNVEIL